MSDIKFEFKSLSRSTTCVIGMDDNDEKIINIPFEDEYGVEVTKIGESAFKNNNNIEEVNIPDTVKVIEDSAFENCTNLKKLRLPQSMREIGNQSFRRCDIQSLVLPKLSTIGCAAFSKNKNGSFAIKDKIQYIKSHAFNECRELICLLGQGVIKKWDDDWNKGVQKYLDSKEDKNRVNNETIIDTSIDEKDGLESLSKNDNEKNDNKQELYEQSIIEGAKGIVYGKEIKLSFPVEHLLISGITVLQSEQINFYQKFIILLLEKGIDASSPSELIDELSNTLNVSKTCVEDFVNYLIENSYIDFDSVNKKYKLCKDIHFTIKPEFNNAMFAELDVKLAECNKIIYIKEAKKCFLEDDFNNGVFRRKGNVSASNNYVDYGTVSEINFQKEEIYPLLVRYFEQTNMHMRNDASFNISRYTQNNYYIEFDALLQYEYSKENKESKLFNTIVLKNNFLPKTFINCLASEYATDVKLPRFLELQDEFYNEVSNNSNEIDKVNASIAIENQKVEPLVKELSDVKVSLNELKKANRQKKKEAVKLVEEVEKKIADKDKEISTNELLISKSSEKDDKLLIENLTKTIKTLKKDKNELQEQLNSKTKDAERLVSSMKKKEGDLNEIINKKDKELSKAKATVTAYEDELRNRESTLDTLITKNKNKINEIIKNVIQKYPANENIFNRYVNDIVIWLDSALSASDCNAVEEIGRCIDNTREMYRKVMQIVFDTLLNKNEMNLGIYMTDSFKQIELDKLFKTRGVNSDIRQRLVMFHEVANAIGHLAENGPKKLFNEKRIADFKRMSIFERNRIILAIPDFFNTISFNDKEVETFVEKLSFK